MLRIFFFLRMKHNFKQKQTLVIINLQFYCYVSIKMDCIMVSMKSLQLANRGNNISPLRNRMNIKYIVFHYPTMTSFFSSIWAEVGIPSPSKKPNLVISSCAAGEQLESLSGFAVEWGKKSWLRLVLHTRGRKSTIIHKHQFFCQQYI